MRSFITTTVRLAIALSVLTGVPDGAAAELTLLFDDPAGDIAADDPVGDLIRLAVTIEETTGACSATFYAADDAPFTGLTRFDLRLTNLTLENYAQAIAELEDPQDVVDVTPPVTSYVVSGVAPGLVQWRGGQHIRASANGQARSMSALEPQFEGSFDQVDAEAVVQLQPVPPVPALHFRMLE